MVTFTATSTSTATSSMAFVDSSTGTYLTMNYITTSGSTKESPYNRMYDQSQQIFYEIASNRPIHNSQIYEHQSGVIEFRGGIRQLYAEPPEIQYQTYNDSTNGYPSRVTYHEIEMVWQGIIEDQRRNLAHYDKPPKPEQASADKKAEDLFKSMLNEEEKAEYEIAGYVTVIANGRRFQIKKGKVKNVIEVDKDGNYICKWCAHGKDYLPVYDHMAIQLTLLKADPKRFLKTANKWP